MQRTVHALLIILVSAIGCTSRTEPARGPSDATDNTREEPAAAAAPQLPDNAVFRPTFHTTQGDVAAGTAFVIAIPGTEQTAVLSAIHVLGPNGGLAENIPASEIGTVVKRLTLTPCFGDGPAFEIPAKVIPIDAAPAYESSEGGDIVAFWLPPTARVEPLKLSNETPRRGTRIWLAASVVQGADPSERLHGAIVTGTESSLLRYDFDNSQISLRATSGAPLIDAEGNVVAINVVGGSNTGRLWGAGNPVDRFRRFLENATELPR